MHITGWVVSFVCGISIEIGIHPMWYDTLVVYLLLMEVKDTASKKVAKK